MTRPTLQSLKRKYIQQFRTAGLDTPDIDARMLMMAATGFSRADLIARSDEAISAEAAAQFSRWAQRRLSGEPIDHILGCREFYGRRFSVSSAVLSPRPETESLVDFALAHVDALSALRSLDLGPRILDLGTGSGAILVSVLAERETVCGVGVDLSESALALARANAQTHGVETRCSFHQGSWFEPVSGRFDLILSNPPYITDTAMQALAPDVKDFDPDLALRGGGDGLDAYRIIIAEADRHLKPGGWIALEIGYDQSESVSALLVTAGLSAVEITHDLAGHPRMVSACSTGPG